MWISLDIDNYLDNFGQLGLRRNLPNIHNCASMASVNGVIPATIRMSVRDQTRRFCKNSELKRAISSKKIKISKAGVTVCNCYFSYEWLNRADYLLFNTKSMVHGVPGQAGGTMTFGDTITSHYIRLIVENGYHVPLKRSAPSSQGQLAVFGPGDLHQVSNGKEAEGQTPAKVVKLDKD